MVIVIIVPTPHTVGEGGGSYVEEGAEEEHYCVIGDVYKSGFSVENCQQTI